MNDFKAPSKSGRRESAQTLRYIPLLVIFALACSTITTGLQRNTPTHESLPEEAATARPATSEPPTGTPPTEEPPTERPPTEEPPTSEPPTLEPPEPEGDETFGAAPGSSGPSQVVSAEELLPSILWGGFGAGPFCGEITSPTLFVHAYSGGQDYGRNRETNDIFFGERLFFDGCRFEPFDEITLTFHFPDGGSETGRYFADEDGDWTAIWWSIPDEPRGLYTVDIDTSLGLGSAAFTVSVPDRPIVTVDCDEAGAVAVLTGFTPFEDVLIARYDGDYPLLDHITAQMDVNGMAILDLPAEYALVVALGQERQFTLVDPSETEALEVSGYDYLFCPG